MFVDTTYVQIVKNEVKAVALEPGEGDGWHMSNNISHNTGYVLDFKMDTPPAWNTWYSPKTGSGVKISSTAYNALSEGDKGNYIPGPTYSTSEGGVFGQRTYTVGELVPDDVVTKYIDPRTDDQATVENAYIASEAVSYTYNDTPKSVSAGTPIPYSEYDAIADAAVKDKFSAARMCISTLRLNEQTYIVYGDLLSEADSRIFDKEDHAIFMTNSLFKALRNDVKNVNNIQMPVEKIMSGIQLSEYDGHPVIVIDIWDRRR